MGLCHVRPVKSASFCHGTTYAALPHPRLGAPLGQAQASPRLSSPASQGAHPRCPVNVCSTHGWDSRAAVLIPQIVGKVARKRPCSLQNNNARARVLGCLWWQLLQLLTLTERGLLEAQMHVGQEPCCQDPKQTVWSECALPSDSGKYHWYSPGNLWNLLFIKVSPSVILSLLLLLVIRMFAFPRDSCH